MPETVKQRNENIPKCGMCINGEMDRGVLRRQREASGGWATQDSEALGKLLKTRIRSDIIRTISINQTTKES